MGSFFWMNATCESGYLTVRLWHKAECIGTPDRIDSDFSTTAHKSEKTKYSWRRSGDSDTTIVYCSDNCPKSSACNANPQCAHLKPDDGQCCPVASGPFKGETLQ